VLFAGKRTVGHAVSNIPQLGKKLNPQAVLQQLHGPAFEGFRPQSNSPVDELQVVIAKFLEQLVEFGQSLG
jgi:hypothetical protein